jgi:hypothetical protein
MSNIREIESGILKKNTVVNNHVYHLKIKKRTKVEFGFDSQIKTPEIQFENLPFVCRRVAHRWYISVWGKTIPIVFPQGGECYPFSFFQHGTAMN